MLASAFEVTFVPLKIKGSVLIAVSVVDVKIAVVAVLLVEVVMVVVVAVVVVVVVIVVMLLMLALLVVVVVLIFQRTHCWLACHSSSRNFKTRATSGHSLIHAVCIESCAPPKQKKKKMRKARAVLKTCFARVER